MAKPKIIWSKQSQIKLFRILDFYIERNKSIIFSQKLYRLIYKEVKILLKQPYLGRKTEFENIRCFFFVNDFAIYYEPVQEGIIIHTIWDCRQSPEGKNIN